MDGLIIKDKHYIFTTESSRCEDCAFFGTICGVACLGFQDIAYGRDNHVDGVFKELKIEK